MDLLRDHFGSDMLTFVDDLADVLHGALALPVVPAGGLHQLGAVLVAGQVVGLAGGPLGVLPDCGPAAVDPAEASLDGTVIQALQWTQHTQQQLTAAACRIKGLRFKDKFRQRTSKFFSSFSRLQASYTGRRQSRVI